MAALVNEFTFESLNLAQHGYYLKSGAWAVVNSSSEVISAADWSVYTVDADKLALDIQNPKSVNLVLLGFAVAVSSKRSENMFFCSLEDIKSVLENRLKGNQKMLDASIEAIETGFERCET
jgi:indolepyruvate ferredoxin oxidoreductase beta subunit